MKVCIATSRPIGYQCKEWAQENTPPDFELTDSLDDADIVISILYDKLFTEDFIVSKKAVFNFHPGILPQYRGAGAFSWAIINRESEIGITLHKIDASIDHGEMIGIWSRPINPGETAQDLFADAMKTIFDVFQKFFVKLLTGDYTSEPQNEKKAHTYYRKDLETAKDLTHFVRAFTFEGKESAYYIDRAGEKHYLTY